MFAYSEVYATLAILWIQLIQSHITTSFLASNQRLHHYAVSASSALQSLYPSQDCRAQNSSASSNIQLLDPFYS